MLLRKTTTARFRLPMTYPQAVDFITAAYMSEVESRHCIYIADTPTLLHIDSVAQWLTSPRPKFGMLLCGQCGNGKSTLARAVRSAIHYLNGNDYGENAKSVMLVDAKDICEAAKKDYSQFRKLARHELLIIEDLGIEPSEVLDYGNVLNPAVDLLAKRYDDQLFTIVTTNLTPQKIREHYGDRIADRFNEMMERIVFTNPTYRKNDNSCPPQELNR